MSEHVSVELESVTSELLGIDIMSSAGYFKAVEQGTEWLHTPIPALEGRVPTHMLDSHAGREIVKETLRKIEYGEYS